MSYLDVLLYFIVPPIVALVLFPSLATHGNRKDLLRGTFLLVILALLWTTPWDNYLVATGIWFYGEGRVLGTIGYVPIEEYVFFILQTLLVGLWVIRLNFHFGIRQSNVESSNNHSHKLAVAALFSVWFLSLGLMWKLESRYLGLILVWALPVIGIQWWFGFQTLVKNIKFCLWAVLPPTIYLWLVDSLALFKNVWTISSKTTVGWGIGILPLEEALFFFVTTLMVAQGLILFVTHKNWLFENQPQVGRWLYGSTEGRIHD